MFRKLFTVLMLLVAVAAWGTPSAQEVMSKAAATLTGSNGVTVRYNISVSDGGRYAGTVIVRGSAFYLDQGRYKTWYNGKTMTTLDTSDNAATISTPTAAEVNQICPTAYITSWAKNYTASMSKKQPRTGYCVILTGKSSAAAAGKAVLTVNANFTPQKLVVSLKNGTTATITLSSVNKGGASTANNFRFPSAKYRKVRITDLR